MTLSNTRRTLVLSSLGLALVIAWPGNADAGRRGSGYAMVTTTSTDDPYKRITAPMRRQNGSWEVHPQGSTWLPCFGGCVFTLQQEHLDSWERINEDSDDRER